MRKPSPSMIVALAALFVALGGVGVAATGGNFILGQSNSADKTTTLASPVAGKALQITNSSTASGGGALGLNVAAGHAPLTVNSGAGKATNLNADLLDGRDSTYFLPAAAKAVNSDKLDGIDSTGFLAKTGKAADSDKLDGIDSTGFVQGKHYAFEIVGTGSIPVLSTPLGFVQANCDSTANLMYLQYVASSTDPEDVYILAGGTSSYQKLTAGTVVALTDPNAAAESTVVVQVLERGAAGGRSETIIVSQHLEVGKCVFGGQAYVQN